MQASSHEGAFEVPTRQERGPTAGKGFPKASMHNGSLKSLEEVVHFYNTRDVAWENRPPPEVPYNLNDELFEGHPTGNFDSVRRLRPRSPRSSKPLTDGFVPGKK